MRTFFRHSRARFVVFAAIVSAIVAVLAFDLFEPVTPMEQQAMVGAILLLSVPALWLL